MPLLPDIGLGELLLIGLVALFIVGPERLPIVMEKLGILTANLRHFISGMLAGYTPDETQNKTKAPTKNKPNKKETNT